MRAPATSSPARLPFVFRAPVLTMGTWEGQVLSPVKRKRKEVSFTQFLLPFPRSSWGVCVFVYDVLLFGGGVFIVEKGGRVEEQFLLRASAKKSKKLAWRAF